MDKKEYVGVETKDLKIDFDKGKLRASGSLVHEGKHGGISVDIKAHANAGPVVDKVLDVVGEQIDKLIPGDQKLLIEGIKASVKAALEKI